MAGRAELWDNRSCRGTFTKRESKRGSSCLRSVLRRSFLQLKGSQKNSRADVALARRGKRRLFLRACKVPIVIAATSRSVHLYVDATLSHVHYPYKYHTFSSYRCISATAAILLYILSTSTKFPHPSYLHCTMRLTVRDTKEQVGNYVSSSLSTLPRSVCRIFRDRY